MRLFSYAFTAMGSPCEVRLYAHDSTAADAAADSARKEIRRLEEKYSRYRDDSLTMRIARSAGDAEGVEVDDESAGLLDYAQTAWQYSDGLFDITSGVLRRVWDFKARRIPEQAQIDSVLPLVGWQHLRWRRPRLVLPITGMELDFGGYVKEYAADRAARTCRAAGIVHGFVELGGDVALIGPHPDGSPWRIGVRDPRQPERAHATIALTRGAIASSGDYERYFELDGRRYCHILDPRSGWPVDGLAAVSVVADDCLVAGTASTIAMLKGEAGARSWLEGLGLRHLCIDRDGRASGSLQTEVDAIGSGGAAAHRDQIRRRAAAPEAVATQP